MVVAAGGAHKVFACSRAGLLPPELTLSRFQLHSRLSFHGLSCSLTLHLHLPNF